MADFIKFDEFLKQTKDAKIDRLAARSTGVKVQSSSEFGKMRNHILSTYKGVAVSHSFIGPDGQYVDCVPIDQQPGLRALGKKAKVAAAPDLPSPQPYPKGKQAKQTDEVAPNLRQDESDAYGNANRCPEGTIPMRRITLEEVMRFETLDDFFRKGVGKGFPGVKARAAVPHRYAHARQDVNNYGGSSVINIWAPTPTAHNFSLSQQWYAGGSGSGLQTVEGGWQVYPDKYNNSKPVLFIYWTADGYDKTGNYNLDKAAFIQVNNSWVIGGAFSEWSVRDGAQKIITMTWYRDPANGNWWLYLKGGGSDVAVGYYPKSLYGAGQLSKFGKNVDYGGEVTGTASGQMGSGAKASEGYARAAYQRTIYYFPNTSGSAWATLSGSGTGTCYTIDVHNNAGGTWATYFYFGGPSC